MPGVAIGNIVSSVTRERFIPKVIDNIYTGNVLLERLRGKARPWSGGTQIKIPTTIKNRSNVGSYSGFDTFTTSQEDVRVQFSINPSEYYANVAVSGIQKALNKGPEAIVDLMAAEFADVSRNLSEAIGSDLYGDGTGNSNKAIAGLKYHVDDATNAATYQGQSRSTYTNLKSQLSTQSGALSFAHLAADYDACQRGTDTPTLGVTTPAVWTLMEALISLTYNTNIGQAYPKLSNTGAQSGISASAGLNAIYFRGVPIIADEMCTTGYFYFLNENHINLYQIDQDPLFVESSKEGFSWTGWKKSINQNAIVGQLLFAGQIVGDSPRTMSRRATITT